MQLKPMQALSSLHRPVSSPASNTGQTPNGESHAQDKGVSTLLKEYMRTLNLSMGKRKRSPGSPLRSHRPADPSWAPSLTLASSPPGSPESGGGSTGRPSSCRALPKRRRFKAVRLASEDIIDRDTDTGFEASASDDGTPRHHWPVRPPPFCLCRLVSICMGQHGPALQQLCMMAGVLHAGLPLDLQMCLASYSHLRSMCACSAWTRCSSSS